MKLSEICKLVVEENTMIYYKYNKSAKTYTVRVNGGNKRGWTLLDNFSASAVLTIWNHVNDENKAKLDSMSVEQALEIAFKIINKYGK